MEGIITDCLSACIRSEPHISAEIVEIGLALDILQIDLNKSKGAWYHVTTKSGNTGFIPKKLVTAKESCYAE